jgi:hypothetical protein
MQIVIFIDILHLFTVFGVAEGSGDHIFVNCIVSITDGVNDLLFRVTLWVNCHGLLRLAVDQLVLIDLVPDIDHV